MYTTRGFIYCIVRVKTYSSALNCVIGMCEHTSMNCTWSQWNNLFSAACNLRTFAVLLWFLFHIWTFGLLAQGRDVNMEFCERAKIFDKPIFFWRK